MNYDAEQVNVLLACLSNSIRRADKVIQEAGTNSVGRKPIPAELKRSVRVSTMITEGEAEALQTWIDENRPGATLSDGLRAILVEATA